MSILTRVVVVALVAVVAAALIFVSVWDIPPPSGKVEKVLPDDRFPR